jgi:pimeloyl-ACP methyl ester carboxylesterase
MNNPSRSGYAPVNGLNMYYEIHGNGKPLVLIHGGGSTIQTSFGNILPQLADHFTVIAVELQAHGHTDDRDAAESFEQDAADVVGLVHYLKIEKAHFFGFSNGGNTAMKIGMNFPGNVEKLIICSAFYKRDGLMNGFFDGMQEATIDNMPAYLKESFLSIKGNDSRGLMRMFEKDRNRMLEFKDWTDEDLAGIKAPCLVLAGDKDVATAAHTVAMANAIPGSTLAIIPGNHGSFINEGLTKSDSQIPTLTVEMIIEFLKK